MQAAGVKADQLSALYRRFDDTFGGLPGVESFTYATYGPMADDNWSGGAYFPGVAPEDHVQGPSYTAVSANFFQTLGTKILQGRGIERGDTATSTHVAVVNRSFVNHYLKGKEPIGEHFGPDPAITGEYQVVGVVDDTRYGDPKTPTRPMYFTPISQITTMPKVTDQPGEVFKHFASNIIVRTRGDQAGIATAMRQALKSINPDIPILRMQSYEEQLSTNFTQEDLVVRLTTLFGLLALLLASIGLYGVTAYGVARRTSEIGIRMALGASRAGVLSMVVRGALLQASIGLVIGIPLTFAAGRLVQHSLYQTSTFQPVVLLSVIALLLTAALAAALVPARRAASIDPMRALRTE